MRWALLLVFLAGSQAVADSVFDETDQKVAYCYGREEARAELMGASAKHHSILSFLGGQENQTAQQSGLVATAFQSYLAQRGFGTHVAPADEFRLQGRADQEACIGAHVAKTCRKQAEDCYDLADSLRQ